MSISWIEADWPAPEGIVAGTTLRNTDFTLPAEARWLNQVHGTRVVRCDSREFESGPPNADAVIGDRPGSLCIVKTADCLPVLLCSRSGSEIAAIHAGWRGLSAGVIEATLTAMKSSPTALLAWFGPAISQRAYEVGDEVREAFCAWLPEAEAAFELNDRGRWQADLYLLARQRLAAQGVEAVYGGGLCTFAEPERFHSYRRDEAAGRLLSFIYKTPSGP
jgi:YfiH family protein